MGNESSTEQNERNEESTHPLSTTTRKLPNIRSYDKQYIDGTWMYSTNNHNNEMNEHNTLEVIDANTGRVVATVPNGTEDDTNKAITAAQAALPAWSALPQETRMKYIFTFLTRFRAKKQELVNRLIVELGCTKKFASDVQVAALINHTITTLDLLSSSTSDGKQDDGAGRTPAEFQFVYAAGENCTVIKEPVGVVGCITPWNYPLNQIALKVIPALLTGCTVVLKPSEVTPLVAYSIAEAFHEAHLPKGVFNMIMGEGPECGELLARHPNVALVSFTGSTRAGQILTKVAAESGTMKPIKTELGGKSAALLLEDADYEVVVPIFVKQLMANTGQSCNALSRMIVPAKDHDKVVQLAAHTMSKEIVGDSRLNKQATMGPLISKRQYEHVMQLITTGIEDDHATLVYGGNASTPIGLAGQQCRDGYFVQPTLFSNVTNDMTIAQTEIFGPVLCILKYHTVEEGIKITNETPYGLNNAVASRDVKKAIQVASQLQSGMVMINTTNRDYQAPFGGYKHSGNAREWGISGLNEFVHTKTLNIPYDEYQKVMYEESYAYQNKYVHE